MSNDNNSFELASAPVNIPHRFLTLAGAVVLGMILGAPSMMVLLMGMPGNCESSPKFCSLWEMLAFLSLSPVYLGILGAVLAVYDTKGACFRWDYRLCILVPLGLSLCTLVYLLKPIE